MTPTSDARTASAVTRKFFDILHNRGISVAEIARETDLHSNTVHYWKNGRAAATVINMEAALQIMGLKLEIVPINPEPEIETNYLL